MERMHLVERSDSIWHSHSPWYMPFFVLVAIMGMGLLFWSNAQFAFEDQELWRTASVVVSQAHAKPVRVTIDFGTSVRAFEGSASQGLTVEDALQEIAYVAGLKIEVSRNVLKTFGSDTANTGKQWVIYLNDKKTDSGALSESLAPGDTVLVRYE